MAKVGVRRRALHSATLEVTMSGLIRYLILPLALVGYVGASAASPEASGAPLPAKLGYHVVDRIPMTDGWWDYTFFEPVHRRIFVARGNGVFKLDVDTGLMDSRLVPGSEGRAVVAVPGGEQMLTTMAGYSSAILFAANDGTVSKMFRLRQAPDAIVWEPLGQRFWVVGGSGELTLLDPATMKEAGIVDLREELEFAVTDGHGRLFVNAPPSASVIAVDTASRKVIGHWKMAGCEDPSGLAYSAEADVLLSVCANKMLKVLDARTGAEYATVPVGQGADAVIYDAGTRRAFVPSAVDGLLTVLDVRGPHDVLVLEQVPTQIGTRTGAIDPKTGTLYLPTARFGPLNKLGWPEALAGTVQLLVMRPQ
jgi:DNA-binding beta-propeller fold protein YncE